MKKLIQIALAWLRWMHIDAYAILKTRAERRMWRRAFPKDGQLDSHGLCVAVPLRSFCSEAQVGRDFVRRLMKTSIPFSLFDLDCGFSAAGKLPESEIADLLSIAKTEIRERNVFAFVNGPIHGDRHYVYSSQMWWEFACGLLDFMPQAFEGVRHVVLMSDFCADYFKSIVPAHVATHKIRYGYDESWRADEPRSDTRRRYGVPEDAFVVIFHFMFGSSAARKNPFGALAAFRKAFENEPRAHLVLKVAETNAASADFQALLKEVATFGNRVTIVDKCLSRQEILNLIAASDAYLSLHRGEGLGIGMLEAMAVGTPVVCTNYGGNTEFCLPETAFLVDYTMMPNSNPDKFYVGVPKWPEPNVDTAAQHLRAIFDDSEVGRAKAERARTFIQDHFLLKNFESDVRQFVDSFENHEFH